MVSQELRQFSNDMLVVGNAFCPTGEGGGVDPTCSPGQGASNLRDKIKLDRKKGPFVHFEWQTQKDQDLDNAWRHILLTDFDYKNTKERIKSVSGAMMDGYSQEFYDLAERGPHESELPFVEQRIKELKEWYEAADKRIRKERAAATRKKTASGQRQALRETVKVDKVKGKEWKDSLSKTEKKALQSWVRGVHHGEETGQTEMRARIASGKTRDVENDFLGAVSRAPVVQGEVFRGLMAKDEAAKARIDSLKVGGTFSDKAPFSMSRSPAKAISFASRGTESGDVVHDALLRITTKSGRSIEAAGGWGEKEVLSMPGTKYKITAIHENKDLGIHGFDKTTRKVIHLEEM